MPSSKTDTAIRFPESNDQKRRIRNVTQDRHAIDKMKRADASSQHKAEDATSWGTEQTMATSMDDEGNPKPDPTAYSDGWKASKKGDLKNQGMDMYGALNDEFD